MSFDPRPYIEGLRAAHALSLDLILITNNTREFRRVSRFE